VDPIFQQKVGPIFQVITGYMENGMATGALRSFDASLTTVSMMATILVHQELHTVISMGEQSYGKADDAVTAYSRFWLSALIPTSAAKPLPLRATRFDKKEF
jgi:hypothetical protein